MEPDKNNEPESEVENKPVEDTPQEAPQEELDTKESPGESEQETPADALSRTPEELAEEEAAKEAEIAEAAPEEKLSPIKKFFRKVNVYFLVFAVLFSVGTAIAIVSYLNSLKDPVEPSLATQELSEEALRQLANNDATVGNTSQTLTIQGNAIISGQTLARGNLNVAGNIQTGGRIEGPTLTISGQANLGDSQINSLQVATTLAVQGNTTLRNLNVAGTSTFGGDMTANQITVTRLILSGNGRLDVPNHISFTGPSPQRAINPSLGTGGSASVDGSDTAGTININTGNNPAIGCFVRINFQQAFTSQPHVVITPVGAPAGRMQYYVDRNTTGFSICSATAPQANQAFAFDYFVMG